MFTYVYTSYVNHFLQKRYHPSVLDKQMYHIVPFSQHRSWKIVTASDPARRKTAGFVNRPATACALGWYSGVTALFLGQTGQSCQWADLWKNYWAHLGTKKMAGWLWLEHAWIMCPYFSEGFKPPTGWYYDALFSSSALGRPVDFKIFASILKSRTKLCQNAEKADPCKFRMGLGGQLWVYKGQPQDVTWFVTV